MDREDEKEYEKLRKDKKKADKKENLKEVAQICNCIGELLAKYGKWEEAKQEHEQELALSEALCDVIGCAVACRKIGECFCGLEQYEKALHYQQRHLSLAKSCDNALEEQRALATIGRTYLIQTDSSKSPTLLMQVSKKAEEAFKKSLDVCEKLKKEVKAVEYMEMKARLYLNLGLVYDGQGKVSLCAEYMKRAISIADKHKLFCDLYRCQFSLATMYQRAGNLSQAMRYLESAHRSAVKLKDKYMESEALAQKAQISLLLGDFSSCKHNLKRAHKLGSTTEEEGERIIKTFKSATKMEEASHNLESMPETDSDSRMRLFETLGDCSADAGNFSRAIEYYSKMLECAITLDMPAKDLIPIYISLAQTYADDKQYTKAIECYKKEIELRGDDQNQICRSWLNIAELEEQNGQGYNSLSQTYLTAFSHAKKAKQHKLQIYVLKALLEVQKHFRKEEHLNQTQKKYEAIKSKYDIDSDDELLIDDKDSQRSDPNVDEEGNCSISELSESEDSDVETISSENGRPKRKVQTKRNEKGETPLHRACIEGNLKKVKTLVEQGHQINPRDYCGWIPLHEAANHGFNEIVEYLLDHGAAVNDRGGVHCMGVTPLIDAANCGNMDVLEILMDKGANVIAKDDEGNNALDCLQAWRNRCETLTSEESEQYQRILWRLQSKTTSGNSGFSEIPDSIFTQNSQSQCTSQRNNNQTMPMLKTSTHSKSRRNLRRTVSSDSDSNREEFMNDMDAEIYKNPHLQDINPSSATDSYKIAIQSVGLSANTYNSKKDKYNTNIRQEKEAAAFVEENEFVDDDWLIDDIRPSSKRRKVNVSGAFTSGNNCRTKPTTSKQKDSLSEPFVAQTTTTYKENDDVTRTLDHLDNMFSEDSNDTMQNDILQIDDYSPESQSLPTLQRSKMSKRKRQLKLTNFGVGTAKVQSSKEGETNSSHLNAVCSDSDFTNNSSTCYSANFTSGQHTTLQAFSQSSFTQVINTTSVAIPVTSVKVRVKEKLLVVPVFESDVYKNISWLAKEASQRYYKLLGLQPVLSLGTKDGAILTGDDPVSLVLSSDQEVEGHVESWDLPPISTRYDQACKSLSCVRYRNIQTLLSKSEGNGTLSLEHLALKPPLLLPVFRAIQCQNSLKELRLKGNRLSDAGMDGLNKALASLPNLAVLDISCNLLSYQGIKILSDFLGQNLSHLETHYLQNLTDLNLGHNTLGDGCCHDLSIIISSVPSITRLTLNSCDFTAKLFQQNRIDLAQAMQRSSLNCLDISHNAIGCLGVEQILRCLDHCRLLKLDLTSTMAPSSPAHMFIHHLQNFISKENCMLQTLNLSACQLTSEEAPQISRIVELGKRLSCLNLSNNLRLGNHVLCSILTMAKDTELEDLIMNGCGVTPPLSTEFIDSVLDKLNSCHPLKYLAFTCNKLDKIDSESLAQVWKEHWGELGVVEVSRNAILMKVCDV